MLGATSHWSKTPLPASALFSSGKVQTIPPRSITFIAQQQAKHNSPKHPPTFTHHRRQGHSRQVAFACNIARPRPGKRLGNGHPAPTGLPCRPAPLDPPAPRQANQSPGSALRREAVAGGDSRASHPDRSVHCPKTTCADKAPRWAIYPGSPNVIFSKSFSLRAQRNGSPAADYSKTTDSENLFFYQMAAASPRRRQSGGAGVGRNPDLELDPTAGTLFLSIGQVRKINATTADIMANLLTRVKHLRTCLRPSIC